MNTIKQKLLTTKKCSLKIGKMSQIVSHKRQYYPGYVNSINEELITQIENELKVNSCDLISLIFLLHNEPETALQHLVLFQNASNSTKSNILREWFQHAKHTPTWKHEFIEALLLCQLNRILRKIGIDVSSAQSYYQTDNLQAKTYINPAKKALYKLCENISAENLIKLKKSLLTYDIDTSEYDSCELVFLKLVWDKFITVNQLYDKYPIGFQLDKLVRIIENLPGLNKIAEDINYLQCTIGDFKSSAPIAFSTSAIKVDETNKKQWEGHFYHTDFETEYTMIKKLSLADNNVTFTPDTTKEDNDSYDIKHRQRVGVCVILNQENFYPSKTSIGNANQLSLSKRIGSDKDNNVIKSTMEALSFSVYSAKDLDHKEMFQFIENIIRNNVTEDDSIFILCILSHGVRGHIYAADSVKVNMDDFQNLLDSDIAIHFLGKPKLLIVQACQVEELHHKMLVSDSPEDNYTLKKLDFLIYWATAPELEAYRDENNGSIFIQMLCNAITQNACSEHICDIFTKVTNRVAIICDKLHCAQVPIYHSTLRKKLYLFKADK